MNKIDYDKQRYIEKIRPQIFGDKKCRTCEILLRSKLGAQGTREYCRSCVENGAAKRDQNKRYYKKHKKTVRERVREYHATYREYRHAYYKKWKARNTQTT